MKARTGWVAVALGLMVAGGVPAQETLRVMTYNIRASAGSGNLSIFGHELPHMPALPRRGLKGIAKVLVAAGVDLVGMQEVQARTLRSWGANQTRYIAKRLGGFHSEAGYGRSRLKGILDKNGNSLVSRWPLDDVRDVRVTEEGFEGSPRLVIVGRVRLPSGQHVWFANTHLSAYEGREARLAQIDRIEEVLAELDGPVILVGDFNAEPGTPEMERLLADGFAGRRLRDAALEVGAEQGTFPSRGATRRIDFVLVSEEFEVLSARVPEASEKLSDHLPVIAELRIRPTLGPAVVAPMGTSGIFGIPAGE